ncbi:tetratricopeptide repeat protein [uncultured Clostridium sp.]|uniref:tetratricopeptide repeat protein n=1 Tax=uncultured Clostridium sp. TaxID=59620 RepID=UPI0025DA9C07|nr:hypothetical protein [uncultured Clostridium sp.]
MISEDFNNIYKMVEGLKEDNKEKQNKIISYLQKYSDSITEQIEKLEEQNKDIMVNFQNIIKKSDLTIENIDSLKSVMNDFSRQFKEKDDNLIEGINGIVNEFSTIRNEAENNTNNIIEKNIELHKALDQRIEKIELSNKTGENELIKISENEKKLISLINDVAKMQEKNKNYIDYNKNEFLKEFSEIFERKIEEKLNNIDTKIMDNFKIDKEDNSKRFEILNTKIDSLEQKIIELLKENKELKEEIIKEKEKIKDKDILMNLENKAANGNDEACLKLGDMYYRGIGVVKDIDKALKYYENGQKIGNLKCQNKSFEIYKILAEKGNSKYQYLVGKAYLEGKVVNQNIDTALQWYKKSAKNGYEEAKKMVVKMYTMLAKNNNDSAMYEIGKCYYDGFCVEKDIVKAYDYFNKAAELGNVNAINILKK